MRQGQAKVLSNKEIKIVLQEASEGRHGKRDVCIVQFSFLCGLRVKEIAALRYDDIVDPAGKIRTEFNLQASQSKGYKSRPIYLANKKIIKAIEEYLTVRGTEGSLFFRSQKEGRFSADTLQALFRRLYKKAEIVGASSHSGRRTFATRLLQNGYDIKSVSVLMGHNSIQMTARYVDTNPVILAKAVASL